MSEPKKEVIPAQEQLAVTTNTIVERFSGPDQQFDTIEKTAHLKEGLEIPLMVVASIPDDLEVIFAKRLEQNPDMSMKKKLRYVEAIARLRSLDKHFLQLSVASRDGKRADGLLDLGKAIQSHNASQTEDKGRLERMMDKVRNR